MGSASSFEGLPVEYAIVGLENAFWSGRPFAGRRTSLGPGAALSRSVIRDEYLG